MPKLLEGHISVLSNSSSLACVDGSPDADDEDISRYPGPETNNLLHLVQSTIDFSTTEFREGRYESAQEELMTLLNELEREPGKHSDTRHKILQTLATSYLQQRKWDDAENVAQKLIREKTDHNQAGHKLWGLFHVMAELSFRDGKDEKAESWCHWAVEAARERFGKTSVPYHESVSLLVEILEKRKKKRFAKSYNRELQRDSIHHYIHRGEIDSFRDRLENLTSAE